MKADVSDGENFFGKNSALVAIEESISVDELLLTADFIERIRVGIDLKVEVGKCGQCDQEPKILTWPQLGTWP